MKTNNHPAHGPLTTERLGHIRGVLQRKLKYSNGGNMDYIIADAVKAIDELLEMRKAEPVAWMVRDIDTGEKFIRPDMSYFEGSCQPLYTAPPAPVAIDERAAFNAWNNEDNLPIAGVGAKNAAWLAWQARAKLGSPPAPVVPPAIEPDYEVIKGILPTANPDEYACCIAADMWNACRAAMLNGG